MEIVDHLHALLGSLKFQDLKGELPREHLVRVQRVDAEGVRATLLVHVKVAAGIVLTADLLLVVHHINIIVEVTTARKQRHGRDRPSLRRVHIIKTE